MTRPRAADDFRTIRTRMEDLRRKRARTGRGHEAFETGPLGIRFARDSPLEGQGFEPTVPREISDAFESAPRCKLPQSTPSNWVTACAVARRSCSSPRRPVWVRALDLGRACDGSPRIQADMWSRGVYQ